MPDAQWRIAVDRKSCTSSGACAGIAPGHFEIDDEGRSRAKTAVISADEIVLIAVESCPALAITAWELDTGDLIAPER